MYEGFLACCKRFSNYSFKQWEPDWYYLTNHRSWNRHRIEHLYLLARCTSTQGGRPKIEILCFFNIHFCFSPKSEWSMGQFQPKSGKKFYLLTLQACKHFLVFFVSGCIFSDKVNFFKITPPLTQRISFIPSFFGVLGLTEQCLWRCSRGEPTKNYYLRNINSNHNF